MQYNIFMEKNFVNKRFNNFYDFALLIFVSGMRKICNLVYIPSTKSNKYIQIKKHVSKNVFSIYSFCCLVCKVCNGKTIVYSSRRLIVKKNSSSLAFSGNTTSPLLSSGKKLFFLGT